MGNDVAREFEQVQNSVAAYWRAAQGAVGFDPVAPVVRLHEPTFGPEEIMAALECMLTTRITMGPKVKAFEREYADKWDWRNGVMVNSGSSANLLAIAALVNKECRDGLFPGDEVIVPALSWSTTVWPLIQCGLTPVIVDIDPDTLNVDPNEIERAIGPKTRAVMIVPVYGNPCDMDAIVDICQRHNLLLIEDCCESMGATYDGRAVGKFGRVGTFSFYYSHHITTLEGGICVTDDDEFAELMRILRAHGWIREVEDRQRWIDRYPGYDARFLFVNVGYNLRATDPQGAMGSVQLPKLDGFIENRRSSAAHYREALGKYEGAFKFQQETPKGRHTWFGFPITVAETAPFTAGDLTAALNARSVETRPIICGNIARQPALQMHEHRTVGDLKHASAVMDRGLSFGNHQSLTAPARKHVIETIDAFMAEHV
jgi:CDP-6-deoxy-D-xylo-4-hexulose-3-dehydrase